MVEWRRTRTRKGSKQYIKREEKIRYVMIKIRSNEERDVKREEKIRYDTNKETDR